LAYFIDEMRVDTIQQSAQITTLPDTVRASFKPVNNEKGHMEITNN